MSTHPLQHTRARVDGQHLATRKVAMCTVLFVFAGYTAPARAADGCEVLLCLAAPSWRSIPQCVPPITQALRDVSRGKPFPACAMAGAGNSASLEWASAPGHCPLQYTHQIEGPSGPRFRCDFAGAVAVSISGSPFTRTWWSMGGDTVTEFTPVAKAQLGTWDTRFDDDYAAWFAALPPPAPVVESGY